MTMFSINHPWLTTIGAVYLTVAVLGWLFMVGAAIASEDNDDGR